MVRRIARDVRSCLDHESKPNGLHTDAHQKTGFPFQMLGLYFRSGCLLEPFGSWLVYFHSMKSHGGSTIADATRMHQSVTQHRHCHECDSPHRSPQALNWNRDPSQWRHRHNGQDHQGYQDSAQQNMTVRGLARSIPSLLHGRREFSPGRCPLPHFEICHMF